MLTHDQVKEAIRATMAFVPSDKVVGNMTDLLNELMDQNEEGEPEAPYPDEIALTAMQGLLASGHFDGSEAAAAHQAWAVIVPAFYEARNKFPEMMQSLHTLSFPDVSPVED